VELRITDRHGKLSEKVRTYVHEKLEPLSRYWDRTRYLEVVLDKGRIGWKVEVIAHVQRGAPLVASIEHQEPLAAIDLAHDKLERLLTRVKEKVRTKRTRTPRSPGFGRANR
jgi:ribosomal subunit interface protein